jgi:hypothetical protein
MSIDRRLPRILCHGCQAGGRDALLGAMMKAWFGRGPRLILTGANRSDRGGSGYSGAWVRTINGRSLPHATCGTPGGIFAAERSTSYRSKARAWVLEKRRLILSLVGCSTLGGTSTIAVRRRTAGQAVGHRYRAASLYRVETLPKFRSPFTGTG